MKWFLLLLTVFTLSQSFAEQDLPLPLPDEPGHGQQPDPGPSYPDPNPAPPQQPQPPSGPSMNYSLGIGDTGRFKQREITFFPSSSWTRVTRVTLTGTRNNINIKSVVVRYADYGDESYEYSLIGDLKVGTSTQAFLVGRPISSITVTATNKYFWKKPGGFRVDVTAYR